MSPGTFAVKCRRIASALVTEAKAAEATLLAETEELFEKQSSGTLSTETLRMMGHPYAVRAPQDPPDHSIINDQTGKFRRSWRKSGPRMRGGMLRSTVVNVDPVAKYMFGTTKMVARPIDQTVAAMMQQRRVELHRLAIQRALRA
jgi:biotin carboxylase